jgi:two-component system LytT family response regulator
MVNASLIESTQGALHCLEMWIIKACPEIHISCKTDSMEKVPYQFMEPRPELMFLDVDNMKNGDMEMVGKFVSADYEVIFVTSTADHALEAIKYGAAGYIVKPVKKSDFVRTVNTALRKIRRKEEQARDKQIIEKLSGQPPGKNHILGIPTLEGFEFLRIDEIIRCEGLQKCTRIITTNKTDLISSYNLGEFRKLLEPFGFFSPHKSHLINLKYIHKYNREGSIIMHNGSDVPVAKRRKKDFLDQFTHF